MTYRLSALAACVLAMAVVAEEPAPLSGPKLGQRPMPYAFVLATGPNRGTTHCYVCDTADGLYCSSKKTCAKMQGPGAACGSAAAEAACDKTSYCDYGKNACVARAAVGGSCAKDPDACEATAYCNATHTCARRIFSTPNISLISCSRASAARCSRGSAAA